MESDEAEEVLRAAGLDPHDPAVRRALDFAVWELEFARRGA
jgi:hypothetical protein